MLSFFCQTFQNHSRKEFTIVFTIYFCRVVRLIKKKYVPLPFASVLPFQFVVKDALLNDSEISSLEDARDPAQRDRIGFLHLLALHPIQHPRKLISKHF